ncbi:MAG: hypothetical protein JSU72_02950, partial [Deltaproteobacteria bacterium]
LWPTYAGASLAVLAGNRFAPLAFRLEEYNRRATSRRRLRFDFCRPIFYPLSSLNLIEVGTPGK